MYTRESFDAASKIVDTPALAKLIRSVLTSVVCVHMHGEEYSNQRFDLKQNLAAVLAQAFESESESEMERRTR